MTMYKWKRVQELKSGDVVDFGKPFGFRTLESVAGALVCADGFRVSAERGKLYKVKTAAADGAACIDISDDLTLCHIRHHTAGDMAGYITFSVFCDGYQLEGLFRVNDPVNGDAMKLVSIDYGDRHQAVMENWEAIQAALAEVVA